MLQCPKHPHARPVTCPRHHTPRPTTACRVWPFSNRSKGSQPGDVLPDEVELQQAVQQPGMRQQLPQQPPYTADPSAPQQQPELLRTSPKWRWLDAGGSQTQQPQRRSRTRSQQQQQQQEQLSPQQQAALRDMIMDATVNPKWRWPSFGNTDSGYQQQPQPPQQQQQQWRDDGGWSGSPPPPPPPSSTWPPFIDQQQQQQQQAQAGFRGRPSGRASTPPPPPPPPPPGFSQQQQQQGAGQGGRWQQQQPQRQRSWWWPFGGSGLDAEDEAYRQQLEAMGVDLVGSRARQQEQQKVQQRGDDIDFDRMDDRQIAAYMNQVRQNRLERVANKQDDEVVGIVGLYLSITMVILTLAALANLPV